MAIAMALAMARVRIGTSVKVTIMFRVRIRVIPCWSFHAYLPPRPCPLGRTLACEDIGNKG